MNLENLTQIIRLMLVFILFSIPLGWASVEDPLLSDEAIYFRCFGHLANSRPAENDTRLLAIRAGTLNPVDACVALLETAELTAVSNTKISNTADTTAKSVIKTLHDMHHGWYSGNRFQGLNDGCGDSSTGDIYDPSQPAAYLTRALLKPSTPFSSVFSGTTSFRPVRDDMNPATAAHSGLPKTSYPYRNSVGTMLQLNLTLAGKGEVLGIEANPAMIIPDSVWTGNNTGSPNFTPIFDADLDIKASFGGGVLGDQVYLLHTVKEDTGVQSNGSTKMLRKWARSVFQNFLCRPMPVVRQGDGVPWVNAAADAPFRTSSSCIKCHVSMDRMSAINRQLKYTRNFEDQCSNTDRSAWFFMPLPNGFGVVDLWPVAKNDLYPLSTPEGVLFYRNFDGALINQKFTSLDQLGAALAGEDSVYVCAAKRYYEFFTGISANINDIANPFEPVTLNSREAYHRDQVISLGKKLRSHQSLKQLIREIMSTSTYQQEHFGVWE